MTAVILYFRQVIDLLFVHIISVGKLKEKYWSNAIAEYEKRLKMFCRFKITEVQEEKTLNIPNDSQIAHILEKEGSRIEGYLGKNAYVIALCIEGKLYSSTEMAELFSRIAIEGYSEIDFIIGGSWGIAKDIKQMAHLKLSMSKMTFPHQLARVMLSEQIYRCFQINSGGKYHK